MISCFPPEDAPQPDFKDERLQRKLRQAAATKIVTLSNFVQNSDSMLFPRGLVCQFSTDAPIPREPFMQAVGYGFAAFRFALKDEYDFFGNESRVAKIKEAVNRIIVDEQARAIRYPAEISWSEREYAPELGNGGRVGLYNEISDTAEHVWILVFAGAPRAAYDDFEANLEARHAASIQTFDDPIVRLVSRMSETTQQTEMLGAAKDDIVGIELAARRNRAALATLFAKALEPESASPQLKVEHEIVWNTVHWQPTIATYGIDACHGTQFVEYGDPVKNVVVYTKQDVFASTLGFYPCVARFDSRTVRTDQGKSSLRHRHFVAPGDSTTPASLWATWQTELPLLSGIDKAFIKPIRSFQAIIVRHSSRAYDGWRALPSMPSAESRVEDRDAVELARLFGVNVYVGGSAQT